MFQPVLQEYSNITMVVQNDTQSGFYTEHLLTSFRRAELLQTDQVFTLHLEVSCFQFTAATAKWTSCIFSLSKSIYTMCTYKHHYMSCT